MVVRERFAGDVPLQDPDQRYREGRVSHGDFISWPISLLQMALPLMPASRPEKRMDELRGGGEHHRQDETRKKRGKEKEKMRGMGYRATALTELTDRLTSALIPSYSYTVNGQNNVPPKQMAASHQPYFQQKSQSAPQLHTENTLLNLKHLNCIRVITILIQKKAQNSNKKDACSQII
jgi:hypothetical protein